MSDLTLILSFAATMLPFALLILVLSAPPAEFRHANAALVCSTVSTRRRWTAPPFSAPLPAATFPPVVIELAQAFSRGEDCAFALHDALLEAGHTTFAGLFQESNFARSHWIIGRILHLPS